MFSSSSPLGLPPGKCLDRLANEDLDILVIGAGVTGCGCALDAVTRGLRVGLVEARDLAAGTSSRSSKLFHGGLLSRAAQLRLGLRGKGALPGSQQAGPTSGQARAVPLPAHAAGDRPRLWGLGIGVYDVLGAGRGVPQPASLEPQAPSSPFRPRIARR